MQPLEIALEAGLLMIRNGGSAVAADRAFSNILAGCGMAGAAQAVWRLDFAAATCPSRGEAFTVLRTVGPIGINLARASEVAVLSERVASGGVALETVEAELDRIRTLPSPYNRWVMVAVAAATGASFSQVMQGDWGSLGIAFVAAGAGQLLRPALQARQLAVAPMILVCGLLSALVAAVGLRLGFSQAPPAALISSVIYIVPGLPLINGFVDVVSHRYLVMGFERMTNAAFLFLVLAIAIALAHTLVL